jgi:uncharacterized protein (TIGR03435 family)
MRRSLAGLLVFNLAFCFAGAFGQAAQNLTFDAASVRQSAPVPPTGGVYFGPARGGPGTPDPGQITWSYASMKAMLLTAYDVKNYQISGPAWLDTERYDVVARVPEGVTVEQARIMWQNLLAERFGLTVRHEPKEFQVQQLVIAKSGPKLKETSWDPAAPLPPGPPKIEKGELLSPGAVMTIFPDPAGPRAHTFAKAQPISKLTEMLSNGLGHPVLDKTGLTGRYDFMLDYAMNLNGTIQLPLPPPGAPEAAPVLSDRARDPLPDLAAAVQKQLGLALVAGKAMLDVVVVDRINKVPTEN